MTATGTGAGDNRDPVTTSGPVQRQWGRDGARVSTIHPHYGPLYRGRVDQVHHTPQDPHARSTWRVADQDGDDHGAVVGDYADAEHHRQY